MIRLHFTLLALTIGTLGVPAQTLREALPPTTLLHLSVPDLDRSFEEFKAAPLFKIWREQEVQEFLAEPLAMAKERIEALLAQARERFKAGELPVDPDEVLKLRLKGIDIALADIRLPSNEGQGPGPNIGLVLSFDFGTSQQNWKNLLDGLLDMAKQQRGAPAIETSAVGGTTIHTVHPPGAPPFLSMNWAWAGTRLVVSLSQQTLTSVVKGLAGEGGASLADDPAYKRTVAKLRAGNASVDFFVKPAGVIGLAMDGLELAAAMSADFPPQIDLKGIRRVIDSLGLLSIDGVAMRGGYQEANGVFESYASSPQLARKGFTKMGSGAPLDLAKLKLVPKDAASFTYSRLEVGAIYSILVDAITAYDPKLAERALGMLAQQEEQLGIKLKDDFFDSIGNEFLMYQMPAAGMMSAPEMGIIIPIKNRDKFIEVLRTLANLSNGAVTISEKDRDEVTIYSVDIDVDLGGGSGMNPMAMFLPSFAIESGHLVMAFSRSDVRRALKRFSDPQADTSIQANKAFAAYDNITKQANFSSVSFTDWVPSFDAMYTALTGMAAFVPIPEEVPIDLALLPTSEVFTKHLFGSISYSLDDGEGFYSRTISPFGPEVIVGLLGAAGVGAGFAATMNR